MSKASKELTALREAVNAYLRVVLVDGDDSPDHKLQPEDAMPMGALYMCLRVDLKALSDEVGERQQEATEALANALLFKRGN